MNAYANYPPPKVHTSEHYCLLWSSSLWSDWVLYLKLQYAGAIWESRPSPPAGPSGNCRWSSPAFAPVPSSLCHSHRRSHICLIPVNKKRKPVTERQGKKRKLISPTHRSELHVTEINTIYISVTEKIYWNGSTRLHSKHKMRKRKYFSLKRHTDPMAKHGQIYQTVHTKLKPASYCSHKYPSVSFKKAINAVK